MNEYWHYFVDCSFDGKGTVIIFGTESVMLYYVCIITFVYMLYHSIKILLIGAFYILLNSICFRTYHLHASSNLFKMCLQISFNLKNVTRSSTLEDQQNKLSDNAF